MIRPLIFAIALLAGACAQEDVVTCEVEAVREAAFSAPGAADVIAARSLGRECGQAIGVLSVTLADGQPVWAYAAPLSAAFGEGFIEPEPEAMRAFLERWAQAEITSAAHAPSWTQLEPGQTTLDRLTYDDIRARNLPTSSVPDVALRVLGARAPRLRDIFWIARSAK